MNELFDYADHLGVTIEWAKLKTRNGEYRDDLKRIRLKQGMPRRLERFTLAHELAHATFGDVPTMFPIENARQEERADEWAAHQLIDIDKYREVEQLRDGHQPSIAYDLDVVTPCITAYQRLLARFGDSVYVRPRMGTGAWSTKTSAYKKELLVG